MKEHKQRQLAIYAKLAKRLKRAPTNSELRDAGIDIATIRGAWGNFAALDEAAHEAHPECFTFLSAHKAASKNLPSGSRYVVTTAVGGHPTNRKALESIKKYCELNDARLLVITCEDPASNTRHAVVRQGYPTVERILAECSTIVGDDLQLNQSLVIRSLKVGAKQIDPTAGMLHLGARGVSCVIASPKQRMRMVPGEPGKPHVVMTTGAITLPAYTTDLYWSKRTAYLATHDSVPGAVVVEIDTPRRFFFRHIRFADDGSFYDLGVRYSAKGAKFERPEAIVFGDLHVGREEPAHREARYRMLEELQPKRIVVHDVFDGQSISHHDAHKHITRARRRELTLEVELAQVRLEIEALAAHAPVYVVKSNHDEWLPRYLEGGTWVREPQTFETAVRLVRSMFRGEDPLAVECAIDGVVFLGRNDSLRVAGVECGQHGDLGPNGGQASARGLEASYGDAILGHTHSPEIWRSVMRVGTSTGMRIGYNDGPSSWANSHALVYRDGSRQLVTVIDGRWRC